MDEQPKQPSPAWEGFKAFWLAMWKNVVKPAVQDVASNMVTKTANRIIYQTPIDQNRLPSGYQQSYPGVPWTSPNGTPYPTRPAGTGYYKTASPEHGIYNVSAPTQPQMDAIFKQVSSKISIQGSCSLADLYTMAKLTSAPSDCNIGWESMNGFRVKFNPGTQDYTLETPDIVQL